jgi:uncharacterized protein affecting Mg2+/Co2+ transport
MEEEQCPFKIPNEILGLYRIHDGQECRFEDNIARLIRAQRVEDDSPWANGLFGGYAAYDHFVSVMLLPLRTAIRVTKLLQDDERFSRHLKDKFVFACSPSLMKTFLVDIKDQTVWIFGATRGANNERASPANVGLLGWMQEYARRLEQGIHSMAALRPEDPADSLGISLMPAAGPLYSSCVTRGVEVTTAVVYMPEHPQGWTYRISLRLVEDEATRGYKTCQLTVRHWIIQEEGRDPEHVRGDGVIGLFPILADGGWILNPQSDPHRQYGGGTGLQNGAFSYQSCSGRNRAMKGTFAGEITMVPGTKKSPSGKPFDVIVKTFPLVVPDYIF